MMVFFGFFNVYSLRVNLSVGIVAMTANRTVHYDNGTVGYVRVFDFFYIFLLIHSRLTQLLSQEQYFPWNSKERGLILSSFFWGYITTQFLGGLLAARFGGNLVNV